MNSRKYSPQHEAESSSPIQADSPPDDCLGYALRRAQLTMLQDLLGDLSCFDMRPAQFSTLVLIESNPGIAQRDLARALDFDPPQLVMMLNKLESQGLAMRVRRKSDSHGC
jgi:DNA-binding MarR family transcriptional regulator